jgi:molecular chaperone DnaK
LNEDEIKKMVEDAEKNREADQRRKEVVNARNELDGLVYSIEKTLKESGEKVSPEAKAAVEEALKSARPVLEKGDDVAALKAESEKLQKASGKMAEELYKEQTASAGPQANGTNGANGSHAGADEKKKTGKDDDVIDADFKEV